MKSDLRKRAFPNGIAGPFVKRFLPDWRIEVRESTGEILPACLGLEFELADFEVQPLPPRYAVVAPRTEPIDAAAAVIDLVGKPPKLPTIDCVPNNGRAPSIAQQTRRLLTGKGGST
jgi:hypothetical protein